MERARLEVDEDGLQQFTLVAEVVVEGAPRHAGALDHLFRGGARVPGLREQRARNAQQRRARAVGLLGLAATWFGAGGEAGRGLRRRRPRTGEIGRAACWERGWHDV